MVLWQVHFCDTCPVFFFVISEHTCPVFCFVISEPAYPLITKKNQRRRYAGHGSAGGGVCVVRFSPDAGMCVCVYVYTYVCMYVCIYVCMYVCMYIRMYIHKYVYTYIHIRMYE